MDFTKYIIIGILWYICHKYIRKALNKEKWEKWNDNDEKDAILGGIAAIAKSLLKTLILG